MPYHQSDPRPSRPRGVSRCHTAALVALFWVITRAGPSMADPSLVVVAWDEGVADPGQVALFPAAPPWQLVTAPLAVGRQATLRHAGGLLYAVSPVTSTVTVIDVQTWTISRTVPITPGCAPVDIAVIEPNRAYVSCSAGTHLLRLDPVTGDVTATTDLSPFADSDGVPDMSMMIEHEGRLFVQVQRQDSGTFQYATPAMIVVVDLATETVIDADAGASGVQAIELAGTAPKFKMHIDAPSRRLYVSASGGFFDEGGLEAVDLDALNSLGLIVAERSGMVGADLGAFGFLDAAGGVLTFSTDLLVSSHLVPFTVSEGVTTTMALFEAVGYFVPTLPVDGASRTFFFPDSQSIPPAVHVLDADSIEHLGSAALPAGATPTDVIVITASPAVPAVSGYAMVALFALCIGCGVAVIRRRSRLREL